MEIQGKAGQAPINAECGPFGMATIDTSKWGRQQDLQKPAGQVSAVENLFKNGFKFLNKAADAAAVGAAGAAGASYTVNSSGSLNVRNNHFGISGFRMQSKPRSRTVLCALPKGAEGSWGDVDRTYVIGGNWKSNGDFDFVNSFPEEVLAKAEFDTSNVEVVVAPTDLHLTTA
jgi:hypothetical protein